MLQDESSHSQNQENISPEEGGDVQHQQRKNRHHHHHAHNTNLGHLLNISLIQMCKISPLNKTICYKLFLLGEDAIRILNELMRSLGLYDAFDWLAKHLAKHPILAFGISAATLSIALPFLIFTLFALATILMTFTGFVVIEGTMGSLMFYALSVNVILIAGTLITIASVLLFGFLGSAIIILLFFGGVIVAGYFGFMHIYGLFDATNQRHALNKFIVRESPVHRCPHAAAAASAK